jgi:hypothetical protein
MKMSFFLILSLMKRKNGNLGQNGFKKFLKISGIIMSKRTGHLGLRLE